MRKKTRDRDSEVKGAPSWTRNMSPNVHSLYRYDFPGQASEKAA